MMAKLSASGVFCLGLLGAYFPTAQAQIVQQPNTKSGDLLKFFYTPKPAVMNEQLLELPADLEFLISSNQKSSGQMPVEEFPSSAFFYQTEGLPEVDTWQVLAADEHLKSISLSSAQMGKTTGLQITISGAPNQKPFTFSLKKGSVRSSEVTSKNLPALPQPPAPFRIDFTEKSQLINLGELDEAAAANLQVSWHGSVLPILVEAGKPVLVFAPFTENISSDKDVLFVDPEAVSPSPSMQTRSAFQTLAPANNEVAIDRKVRIEPALTYERSTPLPVGTRTVAYRISQGQSVDTVIPLTDAVLQAPIKLTVGLVGLTTVGNDPEHIASLSVVGESEVGQASWGGRTEGQGVFTISPSTDPAPPVLDPAPRTLTLRHSVPISSIPSFVDTQVLDWVQVEYLGYPKAVEGIARVSLEAATDSQPRRITVGGFPEATGSEDVLVMEITNPAEPIRLIDPTLFSLTTGETAVEFEAPASASEFYAQLISTLPGPAELEATTLLPELPEGELKGIGVCEASLLPALAPLLQHRGTGYLVLDPDAAYDAFNHGQESPEALRTALAELISRADSRVDFPTILLVGHATFDPSNKMKLKEGPQVPTFIEESVDSGFTIENSVDFPYGLLFGDDDFQDASVGRLPVKSAAELSVIVDRIISFETTVLPQELIRPVLFVSDDDPEILLDADLFPDLIRLSGIPFQEIRVDLASNGTTEQTAFREKISQDPAGVSLILYTGHGNTTYWASERIITAEQIPNLMTQNKWPIVATFTCLNGNYALPNATVRSLGEAWSITPNGGATANITPCSIDYYRFQRNFSEIFLTLISEPDATRPKTIGEALTRTRIQHELLFPDNNKTNSIYLLFGDPDSPLDVKNIGASLSDQWIAF